MKTAAVICELNPFHNGHALLFRRLREDYGADRIIAVMSGNFVQRGEPAVFDKYLRTQMALTGTSQDAGGHPAEGYAGYADLVLELPPVFAMSSAREFAAAGVRTAAAAGVTDLLGFGIEPGTDPSVLTACAQRLRALEHSDADAGIRELLASGLSYPASLSRALDLPELSPNSILAVEYLRSLQELPESCRPLTPAFVVREGDPYHSTSVDDPSLASATALRGRILDPASGDFPYSAVPEGLASIYRKLLFSGAALHPDDLSSLLADRILGAAQKRQPVLTDCLDVSREIADRLLNRADLPMSFTARAADTRTKQYTAGRISRALLHIALGVTTSEAEALKQDGYVRYLRVLGFRKEAASLLHEIKQNASVPLVVKPADARDLLERSLYFDQIYYTLQAAGTRGRIRSELERSPVIV